MLTESDIAFMREASNEIKAGRQREITVIYETGVPDEFTGEIEDVINVERNVLSVVTEISSGTDIYLDNGIKYEKGDIQLSVGIDLIADIAESIGYIRHDSKIYAILAKDKKGIGERNRYEMIARLTI